MSCIASCSRIFLATGTEQAKRVSVMAAISLTDLRQCRVRLTREPLAARRARGQVRTAVRAWDVPVDPDLAVLLTSDLVTEAIIHGDGLSVSMGIRCVRAALRIDVYHACPPHRAGATGPAGTGAACAEPAGSGHRLVLVAAQATEWGAVRTPGGRALFFTLAFEPDLPPAARRGDERGDGEPYTPSGLPSPLPNEAEQNQLSGSRSFLAELRAAAPPCPARPLDRRGIVGSGCYI